ncbi:hypothetical protein CYLTODRAFT_411785 [Cylindrobasidium torrendii FP15055 ss-10]|uniref:Uncharacterized protein n=1 Tax=Cylindrobasidium torrendii FP15055 ss-10 TaxID=1314674 RepID=A0A0D7BAE2_9AGAR|nr:hypothetical protein CYLTODRAFT_411785 [Cylindrobasidium torrendii FP15055 ss-10]
MPAIPASVRQKKSNRLGGHRICRVVERRRGSWDSRTWANLPLHTTLLLRIDLIGLTGEVVYGEPAPSHVAYADHPSTSKRTEDPALLRPLQAPPAPAAISHSNIATFMVPRLFAGRRSYSLVIASDVHICGLVAALVDVCGYRGRWRAVTALLHPSGDETGILKFYEVQPEKT